MTIDIAKLRAAAAELGYWPATTDDDHLEKLRADNERFDRMNARDYHYDPCDRCGQPTRYKQFPLVCRCTTPDRCPHPPFWRRGNHCKRCGGDARVPRERMPRH